MTAREKLGASFQALLFCVVLPCVLVLWAAETRDVVQMPPYGTPAGGVILIAVGAILMGLGFLSLRRQGGRLVTTGVYRWLPHPIYLGFALATLGIAMIARSPSGLWLVAPAVMLGCAALVWGYERPELERRYGPTVRDYLWLPADSVALPSGMARIRCYLFLLVPWVIVYEILVWSGAPKDAFALALPFERNLPIISWTEPVYMSTYVVVGLTPLLARTSSSLRQFMIRAWLAMAISFSLYLALPVVAPHKPFTASGFWGLALEYERTADPPLNAFPSFHTIWAILTAALLGERNRRWRWAWWVWAAGVAVSCVATGMHWIADVLAGAVLSFALIRMHAIWAVMLRTAERLANSWKEWQAGPVRIANHSLYAAMAVAIALLIVGTLIGPDHEGALLLTAGCGLASAMLWARYVERPRGMIPYSWFGGLVGVGIAALAAPRLGTGTTLLLAAYSVAAPWLQAVGRLRCLVQGCCHGRPAPERAGIRYTHPRSKVQRIQGLANRPLHPTPLYSILWNLFSAAVLGRMWWAGCELHLIAGIFAIMMGIGRFVEEAYRGEPETRVVRGLRLHQWMAAVSVVGGAVLTSLPMSGEAPTPVFSAGAAVVAVAVGVISAVALSVDVPTPEREPATSVRPAGR